MYKPQIAYDVRLFITLLSRKKT